MMRIILSLSFLLAAVTAQAANDWVDLATVSDTTAGFLCDVTDDDKDVQCNTPNPYVDASGNVSVTGSISATDINAVGHISATTISATYLTGDGSGLTGIDASAISGITADQIISGTTNVTAADSASITFTVAGSQEMIIGDTGFVGIGTAAPSRTLTVSGTVWSTGVEVEIVAVADEPVSLTVSPSAPASIDWTDLTSIPSEVDGMDQGVATTDSVLFAGVSVTGHVSATTISATYVGGDGSQLTNIPASAISGLSADQIVSGTTNVTAADSASITFTVAGSQEMIIGDTGLVGIGTAAPSKTLTVSGTVWGNSYIAESVSGANEPVSLTVSPAAVPSVAWDDVTSKPAEVTGMDQGVATTDSVLFAGVSVTGHVSATTISATYIGGDGSQLTNIPASAISGLSADQIISGTTNVTAADSASITFTVAGSQEMIIGDTGLVGIGTTAPSKTLTVSGTVWGNSYMAKKMAGGEPISLTVSPAAVPSVAWDNVTSKPAEVTGMDQGVATTDSVLFAGVSVTGHVSATTISATYVGGDGSQLTNIPASAISGLSADQIISGTTNVTAADSASITFTVAGSQEMIIGDTGLVGIGTAAPSRTLTVSGTVWSTGVEVEVLAVAAEPISLTVTPAAVPSVAWDDVTSKPAEVTGMDQGVATTDEVTFSKVGVNTTVMSETLNVSGAVQITGDSTLGCSTAGHYGTLRMSASGKLQLCKP